MADWEERERRRKAADAHEERHQQRIDADKAEREERKLTPDLLERFVQPGSKFRNEGTD